MKKIQSLSKKLFCSTLGIALLFSSAKAQVPAKCFEIESILVDACNGTSLEPNNEMVRFKVGPNPINIADIGIYGQAATGPYVINKWPTTTIPWLGLIQNATTASVTASLQATVVASCGHLLEPPAGIIPKGADVLMITSTNVSTVDNSFSTLTDTLYIVYHNANYTVTTGHFKNWTSVSSTRSLILANTATGCTDTATYDVSLLTNISGGNGDRVDYSWPGVPTYLNIGCNAPFTPTTSYAGADTSVCNGIALTLTGVATGNYSGVIWQSAGSGTFSSPSSFTTTYTPSAPGTYPISLGVITPCNDTVFSTLTLTVLSPPSAAIITASGSTTICAGSSVTLTASGGSTYSWSTGALTPAISVSTAGTYTVTASNSCGSQMATQSIVVTPLPSVTINNSSSTNLCAGSSLILWATGVGNYSWSTGSTNDSITVSAAGTYSVTASNSCGSVSSSLTINGISPPSPVITPSGSTTICAGDSVMLTASGGTSYVWSTGAATPSVTLFAAGTYTVTATNTCGSQTATQVVSVTTTPSVTINSTSTSFCTGSSLLLWATGSGSYTWTGGSTNDSITVAAGGTYSVTSTSSCGIATDNISITQLPLPNALITPVGSTTICAGSTLVLNGSGGVSYLWQPMGVSTSSVSVSTAGTYTLTATNSCGSDVATIAVTTLNPPTAAVTPGGTATICAGDNLTLNASGSGATSFVWSTGTSGSSITVTNPGTYYVVAMNTCGTDTASMNVLTDNVIASFTGDTTSGVGPLTVNFTNASSSNAITFLWNFGNGTTSSSVSPSTTFQTPGVYDVTLTVTNANGCTNSYTIQITVLEFPSTLVVPNVFSPNNDGYNDLFLVTSTGIKEFNCVIYDRWGLKIKELTSIADGWNGFTQAGTRASDGTYYYIIKATGLDKKVYNLSGFVLLTR